MKRLALIALMLCALTGRAEENDFLRSVTGGGIANIPYPVSVKSGLALYLPMDRSATALYDYSTLGNDATSVGATFTAAGCIRGGYLFGGDGDRLVIDAVLDDVVSSATGTWAAWVKPAATNANAAIITFANTANTVNLHLYLMSSGKLRGLAATSTGNKWLVQTSASVFTVGTCTHVAMTKGAGADPVLYVNGSAVGQSFVISTDKTIWWSTIGAMNNARIGTLNFNGAGEAAPFNGEIDEAWISTLAFDATQAAAFYARQQSARVNQ